MRRAALEDGKGEIVPFPSFILQAQILRPLKLIHSYSHMQIRLFEMVSRARVSPYL